MSFTPPPTAPAEGAPIPNRRTDAQEAFDLKTDAYLNWLEGFRAWCAGLVAWCATFVCELGTAMAGIEADKNAAQSAATAAETSAQNAAVVAGAAKWVAGPYTQGDAVWSPLSLLTYRRSAPGTSASSIDPALDPAGWKLSGSAYSMPQQVLATPGPHQLVVGMHYVITHPLADCLMPAGAVARELLRVTNQSGATTPVLRANGGKFRGTCDDLVLDSRWADKTFTQTDTQGWI